MASPRVYKFTKMRNFLMIIFLYSLSTLFLVNSVKTSEAVIVPYGDDLIKNQHFAQRLDPYPKRNQNWLATGEKTTKIEMEDKRSSANIGKLDKFDKGLQKQISSPNSKNNLMEIKYRENVVQKNSVNTLSSTDEIINGQTMREFAFPTALFENKVKQHQQEPNLDSPKNIRKQEADFIKSLTKNRNPVIKPLLPYAKRITNSNIFSGIFAVSESDLRHVKNPELGTVSKSEVIKKLEPYSKRNSNLFSGIFAVSDIGESGGVKNENFRGKRDTKNFCILDQCECTNTRGNHYIITCNFEKKENIVIDRSTLPNNTSELNIKGNLGQVIVRSPVFSDISNLDLLAVAGASQVIFKAEGYTNYNGGSPAVRLAVHNCAEVKVEKSALKVNKKQVIHVEMVDIAEIKIAGDAFEHLQNATFRNVSRMMLESRSFAYNPVPSSQGATTTMFFQNVIFSSIPKDTFVNPADEIQLINCDIPTIHGRAFSAPLYHSVLLRNSSIRKVEQGAFSDGTLVQKLSVVACVLKDLQPGAFQAAADSLIFVKNRITDLYTNALNMTAARLDFSQNTIERCHINAISLREWSNITIYNNLFDELTGQLLQPDFASFSLEPHMKFTDNSIRRIADGGLKFLYQEGHKRSIFTEIYNNYFEEKCGCDIGNWLGRKLNGIKHVQEFQKISYCTIDAMLARCMNEADGNVLIQTYLDKICVPAENVQCVPLTSELNFVDDQINNPRFPIKNKENDDEKYELILWISLGAIGILIILALVLAISYFTCRSKPKCCLRERDCSGGSTPTSDIVAQMNTGQDVVHITDANENQNYNQLTRTEEEGQLYPLLTNERLQDLNHRWNSEDEAVRQAACEEIVKLYQTIKRQNNNGGSTTRATNTDIDLYETIEDALNNRRRPPDLLESTVATSIPVPVNDYAQPKDSLDPTNNRAIGGNSANCYAISNCFRNEYSEPDVTSQRDRLGISAQLEQTSSSPIPYMDATLSSDKGSNTSYGESRMVNRPLPKPPNTNNYSSK